LGTWGEGVDSDSLIRATLIDCYNKNSVSKCLARKSRNLVSVESKGLVVFLIFHEDGSILCPDKDPVCVFNMVITSLRSNFCLSFHHQLTSNVDKQIVAAQMHSCCGKSFQFNTGTFSQAQQQLWQPSPLV
jgi:hypothetical protein